MNTRDASATSRIVKAYVLFVPLLAAACAAQPRQVVVAPATAVVDVAEPAPTAANPPVGGVDLPTGRTLATNLAAAPPLATFTRLVAASGQRAPLEGTAAFTVFAPTDEAFGRLALGTVEALLKPENRAALAKLVTLHVVVGRLSSAALVRRVAAGGGGASLTSVAGEPLALSMTGSVLTLTDAGGNKSYVETADVRETNGVIHVVNGVLVPRL